MNRFLAFTYDSYYPGGAKKDFVGDFDSLEEVLRFVKPEIGYMDVLDTRCGKWVEYTSVDERWQHLDRWERV